MIRAANCAELAAARVLLMRNNFAQTTSYKPLEQRKSIKIDRIGRSDSDDSVSGPAKNCAFSWKIPAPTTQDFWRSGVGKHIFWKLGAQSTVSAALQSEFVLEYLVDCLRTCLSARCLHHLADEPSDCFRVRPCIRDLVRIFANDVVHDFFDGTSVSDLLHAALLDDRARIATLVPDDLEQVLGNLAGNRSVLDQIEHRAKLVGRYRRR